jgi:hypothetical protein
MLGLALLWHRSVREVDVLSIGGGTTDYSLESRDGTIWIPLQRDIQASGTSGSFRWRSKNRPADDPLPQNIPIAVELLSFDLPPGTQPANLKYLVLPYWLTMFLIAGALIAPIVLRRPPRRGYSPVLRPDQQRR